MIDNHREETKMKGRSLNEKPYKGKLNADGRKKDV